MKIKWVEVSQSEADMEPVSEVRKRVDRAFRVARHAKRFAGLLTGVIGLVEADEAMGSAEVQDQWDRVVKAYLELEDAIDVRMKAAHEEAGRLVQRTLNEAAGKGGTIKYVKVTDKEARLLSAEERAATYRKAGAK